MSTSQHTTQVQGALAQPLTAPGEDIAAAGHANDTTTSAKTHTAASENPWDDVKYGPGQDVTSPVHPPKNKRRSGAKKNHTINTVVPRLPPRAPETNGWANWATCIRQDEARV